MKKKIKPLSGYSPNRKIGLKQALKYVPKNAKILDLGCSKGYLTEFFKNRGYNIIGTDIVKEDLRIAKSIGLKTIWADFNKKFPFKDNSFDAVVSYEVIEDIYDIEHFFSEVKRILKPGGWFIFSVINTSLWSFRIGYLFGKTPTELQDSHHIRFYSLSSIKKHLKKYFDIKEIKGLTHFPLLCRLSHAFIFWTPFAKSLFSLYFYFACKNPD